MSLASGIVSLGKPDTFRDFAPAALVGHMVRVRPYYHVPTGPYSMKSVRAPWTFEAQVIEAHAQMVKVQFRWVEASPWKSECVFYPNELHRPRCECPACKVGGAGISEHYGA